MGAGCSRLAADSLGPGTLIEQGKTGLLVPINDPPALAKSLKLMLEDEDLRGGWRVMAKPPMAIATRSKQLSTNTWPSSRS